MKITELLFLKIFLISSLLFSQAFSEKSNNLSEFNSDGYSLSSILTDNEEINNFHITLTDSSINQISDYILNFQISSGIFNKLKKGGFSFTFPDGFDISNADGAEFIDNSEDFHYLIKKKKITGQVLTILLKKTSSGDKVNGEIVINNGDTVTISITIRNIINPAQTGSYQLIAEAFKKHNEIIAGPSLSEPFSVIAPSSTIFNLVEDSFKPDTLIKGLAAEISFNVFSEGFNELIDSTTLEIQLLADMNGSVLSTIFMGSPDYSSYQNGLIRYEVIHIHIGMMVEGISGWYPVKLNYRLYSGGNIFTLENDIPDSIYVIFDFGLDYVEGSLAPLEVIAGSNVNFGYDVVLNNNDPLYFDLESSRFTILNDDIYISVKLNLATDSIYPGINSFYSEEIFIPYTQIGNELKVISTISFTIPGFDFPFHFGPNLKDVRILVKSLTEVQIINLDVIAPNSPKVNTSQSFQIVCKVANLSDTLINSLQLNLTSDGASSFEPILTIPNIAPFDTIEVYYNIIAATESNTAEIFNLEIISDNVSQLPPINNTTFITIQTPALLDLTYKLLNVENSTISHGDNFNIVFEISNLGEAEVAGGSYLLTIEGLDLDGADSLTDQIITNQFYDFSFTAPNFDTTIEITFTMPELPVDININQTATIIASSFNLSVNVVAPEGVLFIEPLSIGNNLILPHREKKLFQLNITNNSLFEISLDSIQMFVYSGNGNPVDASYLMDINKTGFFENDQELSSTNFIGNNLQFAFNSFLIQPGEQRDIILITEFDETSERTIKIQSAKSDISARFVNGPNTGQLVTVSSDAADPFLISQLFLIKSSTFENSFIISTNPFNPNDPFVSPVEFSYELREATPIKFRIFTITGEEVYAKDYPQGSSGGSEGENIIEWDGRNNENDIVLNGIYIALIKNKKTDEQARIKIAVLK